MFWRIGTFFAVIACAALALAAGSDGYRRPSRPSGRPGIGQGGGGLPGGIAPGGMGGAGLGGALPGGLEGAGMPGGAAGGMGRNRDRIGGIDGSPGMPPPTIAPGPMSGPPGMGMGNGMGSPTGPGFPGAAPASGMTAGGGGIVSPGGLPGMGGMTVPGGMNNAAPASTVNPGFGSMQSATIPPSSSPSPSSFQLEEYYQCSKCGAKLTKVESTGSACPKCNATWGYKQDQFGTKTMTAAGRGQMTSVGVVIVLFVLLGIVVFVALIIGIIVAIVKVATVPARSPQHQTMPQQRYY